MGTELSNIALDKTAQRQNPQQEYVFSHDDENWLRSAALAYKTAKDPKDSTKTIGTDTNRTTVALLKDLWQIAHKAGISPKEFIKDIAEQNSFKSDGLNDRAYLEAQRDVANKIVKYKLAKTTKDGYQAGFHKAVRFTGIDSSIAGYVKKIKEQEAQIEIEKQAIAAEKLRIQAEMKKEAELKKAATAKQSATATKDITTNAPSINGLDLSPGAIIPVETFSAPVSNKATWISSFIGILKRNKDGTYANPEVGGKIQAKQKNLTQEKLGKLYDDAKEAGLNPKEFLCLLAFNTSFNDDIVTKEHGKMDLVAYAKMLAQSKKFIPPINRTVVAKNGMISDFLIGEGPRNLNVATEAVAIFRSAIKNISDNITVIKVEELAPDPISGARTIQVTSVDDKGLMHVATMEGFKGKPYKCSAGVLTIGYGSTTYIDKDGKEKPIKEGMVVTKEKALEMLAMKLKKVEDELKVGLKGIDLPDKAFQALKSLAYNVGTNAVLGSRCVKALRARDYEKARFEFLDFNKARVNGKPVEIVGLTNRRKKEVLMLDSIIDHWGLDRKKIQLASK